MSEPDLRDTFKTWDVRLIWEVIYPSRLFAAGDVDTGKIELVGADRSSITISRPLIRISSLEQYNQGYQDGVPDIRVSIFTKEAGKEFEKMRRLSATKIPFDITLTLAKDVVGEENVSEATWIDGYEEFLGCRVTNERTNYAIAEFPLREFECMALRHLIKSTDDYDLMVEGDGTYATDWPGTS